MPDSTNQSGCKTQPLTVKDLSEDHIGKRISFHGFPTQTLHEVDHNAKAGYTTMVLGNHKLTVHDGVRVQVSTEVDGL